MILFFTIPEELLKQLAGVKTLQKIYTLLKQSSHTLKKNQAPKIASENQRIVGTVLYNIAVMGQGNVSKQVVADLRSCHQGDLNTTYCVSKGGGTTTESPQIGMGKNVWKVVHMNPSCAGFCL